LKSQNLTPLLSALRVERNSKVRNLSPLPKHAKSSPSLWHQKPPQILLSY
jgi:hypothetical protein